MNFSSPVFVFAFLPVIFLLNGLRKNIKTMCLRQEVFYFILPADWIGF